MHRQSPHQWDCAVMTRFGSLSAVGTITAILACATPALADIVNFVMTLDGSQETPAATTAATGIGTATLDTDTNMFSWNVSFSGLSAPETAAHFHGNAEECFATGIQIGLPLGSPKVGSAVVSAAQETNILNGLWYVNVHTSAFPGGEIRAQVRPTPADDPIPGSIPASAVHVRLQTLATGLTAPNWGINAPGDMNRLFVVDQNGILWAIDVISGVKTVFLDVSAMLVPLGAFGPNTFDERGLLGVAFHPNYQSNGLLYTYTSEPPTPAPDFTTQPVGVPPNHQSVIREWEVPNPSDPNSVVDPGSTRILMRIDEPQFNHNAGCLNFGSDGMLYISLGDGGGADDKDFQISVGAPMVGHGCLGNGTSMTTALGKILRIDPLGNNSANGEYGIPAGNPFVLNPPPGTVTEIWALGFRNPFRFSFDAATDYLYVGDVGQNHIEEIDIVDPGGHYGWRHKEGSFFFITNGNSNGYATAQPQQVPAGLIDPIAEYDHDEGIAVIGGFVYHGGRIAPLRNRYVFGEFATTFDLDGRLFHLGPDNEILEFPLVGQKIFGLFLLGIGQDARGELYALANSNGIPFGTGGVVLRLTTKLGDTNADGVNDVDDLLTVINGWGACPAPPAQCPSDVFPEPYGNGTTDVDDLLTVINNWG